MQSSKTQEAEAGDVIFALASKMHELGVVGLPRNYELFYEAFVNSNDSLRKSLMTLGARPGQNDLDQLSRDYFAQSNRDCIVENAHDAVTRKVDAIMALLMRERNSLEKYGVILDRTSEGLSAITHVSREMLQKIVGIMAAATDTTIEQGKQIVTSIEDHSAELAQVKEKLEEYKTLADTDPLTQLWNRRAFDKAMARIYGDRRGILFGALILADIDRFKDVNDRHGHPVGDRILQQVARIFKASSTPNMFVARTGGEEFAIIVDGLSETAILALAEDIRAIVAKTPFISGDGGKDMRDPVTISLGICMASEAESPEDLYAKADRALYASKLNGRDRLTKYPVPGASGLRKNWMLYRSE